MLQIYYISIITTGNPANHVEIYFIKALPAFFSEPQKQIILLKRNYL